MPLRLRPNLPADLGEVRLRLSADMTVAAPDNGGPDGLPEAPLPEAPLPVPLALLGAKKLMRIQRRHKRSKQNGEGFAKKGFGLNPLLLRWMKLL